MTKDQIKDAIKIIAGGDHHGMIKAAAAKLDVSTKSVSEALSGRCSEKLAARILAAATDARAREETRLSTQAGIWTIAHVETRQSGSDVVDESIIDHRAHPRFSLHVEMLRGKGLDGGARWSERVDWRDEPRDDDQRDMLLRIAREKGQASIYARMQSAADIGMREHKIALAKWRGCPLERDELLKLGPLALSAEAEGIDLDVRLAEMSAEVRRRQNEIGGDACDRSILLGQWMMAWKMAAIARTEAEPTVLPTYIAAIAHRLLPLAHGNTVRGQRVNAGGGVHDRLSEEIEAERRQDEAEMAADLRELMRGIDEPDGIPRDEPAAPEPVVILDPGFGPDIDYFAGLEDDGPSPETESRHRIVGAVRADLEAHYTRLTLRDGEHEIVDQRVKDHLAGRAY